MTVSFELWNALVSTATLLVVLATALAALRQIRHLRLQTTLAGLLKVLDDWRDPEFQAWLAYVRHDLPVALADPAYLDDLDGPVDRRKHPELHVCDWYEQVGSYMKFGLLDERVMMDVSSSSCNVIWAGIEPVITRMRRTRGDVLYENFEYMAARGILYQRAHANGTYPRGTPRVAELGGAASYGKPLRAGTEPAASESS
jgi:hypothetical protein